MANSHSQRYLLIRFFTKDPISAETVKQTVFRSVEDMLGKLGSAQMKARLIAFEQTTGRAVFRCDAGSAEKLRAAVALITHANGKPAAAMVTRSSGTIKSLKLGIQRHRK